jgi:hypothetical protein
MFDKLKAMILETAVKDMLEKAQKAVSVLNGLATAPAGASDKEIERIDATVKDATLALNAVLRGLNDITMLAPSNIRYDIQANFVHGYADSLAQSSKATGPVAIPVSMPTQQGCGRPDCKNCGGDNGVRH